MAQTGVSTMEQEGATITDRTIKTLCLTYKLNEEWIRTGKEPMYIHEPTFSLDKFVNGFFAGCLPPCGFSGGVHHHHHRVFHRRF